MLDKKKQKKKITNFLKRQSETQFGSQSRTSLQFSAKNKKKYSIFFNSAVKNDNSNNDNSINNNKNKNNIDNNNKQQIK